MLTLNAFTNGFAGKLSTTGIGKPEYVEWVYLKNPFDGLTIFEDGWMFNPQAREVKTKVRLGWLVEPRALRPENYELAWQMRREFDYILTYDRELLARDPDKFKLCPRMGVHIPQDKWGLHVKTQDVAMITTQKSSTAGHRHRKNTAFLYRDRIHVYGRDGWADKVQVFSDYRFVVVVESERAENLFTEHLLDAIALGCVPIYWGAHNIGEFLDADGILEWSDRDEYTWKLLEQHLDAANEATYEKMLPALERNLARLPEYRLAEDWIYTHFLKDLAA